MRKKQKQRAEDFVILLGQAHDEIKKILEIKNYKQAMDLLIQCQEGAIKLGELIETTEGEQFVTIPLLEDYCELVYQIHQKIGQNQNINPNKVYKNLDKLLRRIESSVKNDIKVRLEVVFLPYKASMWDSLESVWKAADEDENCDAYVIPIPYFDKNPDKTFGEMHYEGAQYPEYVPVTCYEDYSFAERKPDMIFIHNPYDECNLVTSVHPFFYSKNLKQYTEQLVYIPYFVLGEISPDNQSSVNNMAHFCTVPGVIHANKVIVQSEEMRQIYINVMTEFAGENTKNYWENKILGIGSPKIDKVLNTKKEELEIPKEWLKIIKKPDGSWKKIILYNTSVTALLQHKEKMLEKMQSVFQTFEENQNEVALLWRPHPLIEATIEAMHPQLWKEYQKIVEQYENAGWGIYDDTADLDRAIVLSDGYYGDNSSIIHLYQCLNKAIMIQKIVSL